MSLTNEEEELDYEPEELDYEPEEMGYGPEETVEKEDQIVIPLERSPSPILCLDAGSFPRKSPPIKGSADLAGKSLSVPCNDPQSAPNDTLYPNNCFSSDSPDPSGNQFFQGSERHLFSNTVTIGKTSNGGSGEQYSRLPAMPSFSSGRRFIISNGEASILQGALGKGGKNHKTDPVITFNPESLISADGPGKVRKLVSGRVDHPVSARNIVSDGTDDVVSSSSAKTQYSYPKRGLIVTNEKANESQLFNNGTNLAEPVIRVTFGCESGIQLDTPSSPVLLTRRPKITRRSTSTSDVQTRTSIGGNDFEDFVYTDDPGTSPPSPVLPVYRRSIGLTDSNAEKTSRLYRQQSVALEPDHSIVFPKVTSNPSSSIFSDTCETTFSLSSLNFTSDPPPMADADLANSIPIENGSKRFKPDQAGSSITSYGSHENNLAPSDKPRSILKKPRLPQKNTNEKIVSDCLKLLCKPACDDKEETYSFILRSVSDVFKDLCFEQFFQRGECLGSTCEDIHHYKPHVFTHPKDELWYASLYVISHAAQPNLLIIENLIQHYATKGNTSKTLVFAKCIARVRDSDRLELAHYIINILSGIIPRRNVITVILMLNFSELSSFQYNLLMEGLGVFEQNTTHYSELMAFLNFRGYLIPVRHLEKLMDDAIRYFDDKSDMVESISGFLGRLPPAQMDEVKSVAEIFLDKFRISLDRNDQIVASNESVIKAQKKRIQFAAKPHIREFEVSKFPVITDACGEPATVEVSDNVRSDVDVETADLFNSSNLRIDAIVRVFGESCCTWILTGGCPDGMCRLIHDFTKESLVGLHSEDVYAAADFIVDKAANPSIGILKIFAEFLAESTEITRVLQFRKCASKLSTSDGLALTNLVISLLAKQIGRWEAMVNVLVPDITGSDSGDQFIFDHELIQSIMTEAISTRTTLLRCVTHAILQQVGRLPPSENSDFIDTTSRFTDKFVLNGRKLPQYPDILPVSGGQQEKFGSHLKVALYQGVSNKYFLATAMMKLAVHGSLRDQALDVLYTFLLSHYDRARIFTQLLENCRYFDAVDRKLVIELFGAVGLSTTIRLYESENIEGTAEMFIALKKLKFDIFSLLKSHGNMTELNLAMIYCSVISDTVRRNDAVDVFLKYCVSAEVKSSVLPGLGTLTAKMFWVFTSARSVEQLFKLYNGIVTRQRSLLTPLNIVDYVEPTLRCAFHGSCDEKLRRETLKLYLDVVDSGSPITFKKVTHRSVFLLALMEITHATLKARAKGHINIIHPLIKKILIKCINEGAYPEFSPSRITLFSSMTVEEIKVYVLWWFFLFVRARKSQSIAYFTSVEVAIIQDCIKDDSRLPVHQSLRSVSSSITDTAQRLALFIRQSLREPLPPYANRGRGLFELDPAVVRGLTQTAITLMTQHGYIDSEFDRMCTFCFDKQDVTLADNL